MKSNSVKMRILKAFVEHEEVLTKEEILSRANTTDYNLLRLLVDGDYIHKEWKPSRPNQYRITERGLDHRQNV